MIIAIIIKIIPPIILEYDPNFLPKILPSDKPRQVNIPLVRENIMEAKQKDEVTAFRPIPTDKLSILTDKPNRRNPAILMMGLSSSFDDDMIKSIPIYDKIMVAIKSILIRFILLKRELKLRPIKGIIK